MQSTSNKAPDSSSKKLVECLQGELTAVEAYELALQSITHVGMHNELQQALESHAKRSEKLRDTLQKLGAEVPEGTGMRGAVTKAIQAGADVLGERPAIAALEAGEDRLVRMYAEGLDGLDSSTKTLIERDLRAEQQKTHDLCKAIKDYSRKPS